MARLEKMLNGWVSKNLITNEQANNIKVYESTTKSHQWVFYGFLALGAVIIGIGVISLIASNWKSIPDMVKLLTIFLTLVLLAKSILSAWNKKNLILFEVLLISFMILCLASIGLISQIYHTGGKLYQALLFWSLITSGIFVIANRTFVSLLWAISLLAGLYSALLMTPILDQLFGRRNESLVMLFPFVGYFFATTLKKLIGEGPQTRVFWVLSVLTLLFCLLFSEDSSYEFRLLELYAFVPAGICSVIYIFTVFREQAYKNIQKILLIYI